jgi:nitrogen fixation/metabolism regulation signal transduction histidine kinase
VKFRRRYAVGLLGRLILLVATAFAFVTAMRAEGLIAARLLAALLCVGAIAELWRYIRRTNLELARFVEALRFGDLSQSFSHRDEGSGFGEIGEALEQGMRRLREERQRLSDTNRFYEAVLDDAPIALLTVDGETRVELANKAARRLFNRHSGIRLDDFHEYGSAFVKCLGEEPGGRAAGAPRLVPLIIDSVPQAAMVSSATVHRLGGTVRAVAVQVIQSELNAVELAAQSDLIRVLTHEIMNSMTPVTSLAHTAVQLMATAGDAEVVVDARAAVETLARRADGVMNFVESYRELSRRPQIRRRGFAVLAWARELEAVFRATDAGKGIAFSLTVEPDDLVIEADPDLLSQVLINLLRNGAEAAAGHQDDPAVSLSFTRTRGGRTQIEIADNGPGVPDELAQDVFLPFFTTKPKGSGVGLSLARQLVLAHHGSINLEVSPEGGALFRIML